MAKNAKNAKNAGSGKGAVSAKKQRPKTRAPRVKGFFLVIDGIDGSGKGTILSLLHDWFLAQGVPPGRLLLTAEPTSGAYGRRIRELLRSGADPHARARELLNLYIKDRKEHISRAILPALSAGKIILCDRYKYSTIAYQSAQGLDKGKLISLHKKMPVPNLALILDLPVEEALSRISSDSSRSGKDVFERSAFLEKVRANFLALKEELPKEKIAVIDASGTKEEVFGRVLAAVKKSAAI
ncbi:MAG: dTMP kinase [Candidatus Diapherotrites archaeon]